jgi:thiol:disulfide interchange protein/DsbC/DsbD-like thiol-disulfide interchange protein
MNRTWMPMNRTWTRLRTHFWTQMGTVAMRARTRTRCGSAARHAWLAAACLVALGAAGSAGAAPEVPPTALGGAAEDGPAGEFRVEARLLLDAAAAPPGATVRAGVLFDLDPGWHMYWRFSGQSGLPTEIQWSIVPAGSAGPLTWPAPAVFREADGFITTYGYANQVLLAAPLTLADSGDGPRVVRAEVQLLVCKEQCIPGEVALYREIPVAGATQPADADTLAVFERYDARVPTSPEAHDLRLEALYSQSAIRPGDEFTAGIAVFPCISRPAEAREDCRYTSPADASDAFVQDAIPGVEIMGTGVREHPTTPGGLIVTLAGTAKTDPETAEQRLRGVLALAGDAGPVWLDVDLPLPRAPAGAAVTPGPASWLAPASAGAASPAGESPLSLVEALALAFLGGLILNLMPCVFPVLAIKLFALAELAHGSRAHVLRHAAAYTAGISVSMLALAAAVIGLRTAGVAGGWGFQFQEPLFVLAVGVLLVVFAMNLFGVFEITPDLTRVASVGSETKGPARSFFEGLLAVALATPCSAPFLSVAVGFAFAGSAPIIAASFLSIGLGLAAPYVVLALVPGWGRALPRPGAWMLHVRVILGFSLLATTVWLVSLLTPAVNVLALLLVAAFAAWLFGTLRTAERSGAAWAAALASLLAIGVGARALPLEVGTGGDAASTAVAAAGDVRAVPFDAQQIQTTLARGEPAFVYFTADWCVTCKWNEWNVLATDEVQSELTRLAYTTFVGDWTRGDEAIRQELARFGRAAVPLYLVYSPEDPGAPRLLPELLTVDTMLSALRDAAPATRSVRDAASPEPDSAAASAEPSGDVREADRQASLAR